MDVIAVYAVSADWGCISACADALGGLPLVPRNLVCWKDSGDLPQGHCFILAKYRAITLSAQCPRTLSYPPLDKLISSERWTGNPARSPSHTTTAGQNMVISPKAVGSYLGMYASAGLKAT